MRRESPESCVKGWNGVWLAVARAQLHEGCDSRMLQEENLALKV